MSRLNWLDDFQKANESGDVSTLHSLRMEIFEETVNIVKTGRYHVDGKEVVMQINVGDKVLTNNYAGTKVKVDGEEYTIVRQSDILAVVE